MLPLARSRTGAGAAASHISLDRRRELVVLRPADPAGLVVDGWIESQADYLKIGHVPERNQEAAHQVWRIDAEGVDLLCGIRRADVAVRRVTARRELDRERAAHALRPLALDTHELRLQIEDQVV